jgi:hypothetical protein
MDCLLHKLVRSAMLLACAAFLQPALAADKPPVLKQTAQVKEAIECQAPCDPPAHSHLDVALWKLQLGKSKFEVNSRILHRDSFFFDLDWVVFNEMQDPDLHLLNADKNPLSWENVILAPNRPGPAVGGLNGLRAKKSDLPFTVRIDDFIFTFAIHMIRNADKSKTPHAIIYIPTRSEGYLPQTKGDHFSLLLFHIPDDDRDCAYESSPFRARHCMLLRGLAKDWFSGSYTRDQLSEKARLRYHDLLWNFVACLSEKDPAQPDLCPIQCPPTSNCGTYSPAKTDKAAALSSYSPWEQIIIDLGQGMMLHNGVVHGNLL